jgi:hypothetical protein
MLASNEGYIDPETRSVYSVVSNLMSVKTPNTMGRTSASSQLRSAKWSFFKGKNDKQSQRSKYSSNSKRSGKRRLLAKGMEQRKDSAHSHLEKFIKKHTEYRFGK